MRRKEEGKTGGDEDIKITTAIAAGRRKRSAGAVSVDLKFARNVLMKTNGVSPTDRPGSVRIVNGFTGLNNVYNLYLEIKTYQRYPRNTRKEIESSRL